AQQDGVPARGEFEHAVLGLTVDVAPPEGNLEGRVGRQSAETEMDIGTAASGMSRAAIYMAYEQAAIGEHQARLGADGRPAKEIGPGVARAATQRGIALGGQRQHRMQPQKIAGR